MFYLKCLHGIINFLYFGFFIALFLFSLVIIFTPGGSIHELLYEFSLMGYEDHTILSKDINFFTLFINIGRLLLFISILYFFRKIVSCFRIGNAFNNPTRNYFKYMGFATIALGLLKMFIGIYIPYYFGLGIAFGSLNFTELESTYFIIALGLLFIYIAKVLELSAMHEEENRLTI